MTTTIQKWGNSLGVRLPKELTDKLGLHQGSEVKFSSKDDGVLIIPAKKHKTLTEMVAGITKKNRHPEFDWGRPVGNEVW